MINEENGRVAYRLIRLAAGSYDVELNGEVVASLVREPSDRARWYAELLDEDHRPEPFAQAEHEFSTYAEAIEWLGHPALSPRAAQVR
jgi:hypothetical protein